MFPRALFAAALAAVCIHNAIPFAVNHTQQPLQTSSPQLGPYFANYSLVGQEVECSDAAKRCLAINKLLHEPSGICYELGDSKPCDNGGSLTLDAESFRRGQLHSKCSKPDSCLGFNMAYDGKCHGVLEVLKTFCNGAEDVILHPLGDIECEIPLKLRERVKVTRQPKLPGRCVIPNLQINEIGPFWVECSTMEEECLKKGLFPFRGNCHAPLSMTPCPEGQWLVLDEGAAEIGRLSAKCISSKPCGPDAQLFRTDGSCHANAELSEKLCNRYHIYPLPTGDYICTKVNPKYVILGLRNEEGWCKFQVSRDYTLKPTGSIKVGGQTCVMNDQNICQPVVVSPNAKPDYVLVE